MKYHGISKTEGEYMNVLIAEDECYNRMALVKRVKDELNESDLILEATNGREALKIISENDIDLLLTDIRMPEMDGLELIEALSDMKKDILMIVISGFAEFEYARKALRFGVEDYLLKPVNKQKVRDKLQEMKLKMESRKLKSIEEVAMRGELDQAKMTVLTQQIANLLIHGYGNGKSDIESYLGVESSTFSFCLAAVRTYAGKQNNLMSEIRKTDMNGVFEIAVSNIPVFNIENYVIYMVADNLGLEHLKVIMLPVLMKKLKEWHGDSITSIGISTIRDGISEMNKSYDEALRASLSFYFENQVVSDYEAVIHSQRLNQEMTEWINALKYRIYLQNAQQAFKALEPFFQQVKEEKSVTLLIEFDDLMKDISEDILFEGVLSADEEREGIPVFSSIRSGKHDDLDGYFLNITNYIVSVCYRNDNGVKRHRRNIVETAKRYIEDHYQDNISQDALAKDILFVNASYFSRVFKEQEGISFSKYVKNLRLEKAKDFLKKYDCPISQIAGMVGFNDISYFVSSFKKKFGMTPGEYR